MLAVLFAQVNKRTRELLVALADFEHGGCVLALKRLKRGRRGTRDAFFSLTFLLDHHSLTLLGRIVHGSELRDERLFPIERLRHLRHHAGVVGVNLRAVVALGHGRVRRGHGRKKRRGSLRSIRAERNGILSVRVAISDCRRRSGGGGSDGGCGSHSRVGRRQCDASSSRRQHSLARTLPCWSDGFILLLCFLVFLLSHWICARGKMRDVKVSHELRAELDAIKLYPAQSHLRVPGPPEYGSDVDVKEPRVAGDDAIADAQGLGAILWNKFRQFSFQFGVGHLVVILRGSLRRLLRRGLCLAVRERRDGRDVRPALLLHVASGGFLLLFFLLPRVVERRRGTVANLFLDLLVPPVPDRHPVQLQTSAFAPEKRERQPPRLAQCRANHQPVSLVEFFLLAQADVLQPRSVPVSLEPAPVDGRVEVFREVPPPSRGGRRSPVHAAGERTKERRAVGSTQRAARDAVPLRPARQPVHLPDHVRSHGTENLRREVRRAQGLGVRARGVQPSAHAHGRRSLERGFPARPWGVSTGLPAGV